MPPNLELLLTNLPGDTEMTTETSTKGDFPFTSNLRHRFSVKFNLTFYPSIENDPTTTVLPFFQDHVEPTTPNVHSSHVPRNDDFGIIHDSEGKSTKKRCRCIEKKRGKVVLEVKYIPLSPAIQLGGSKRNFTCKCSYLRKVIKNETSTTMLF